MFLCFFPPYRRKESNIVELKIHLVNLATRIYSTYSWDRLLGAEHLLKCSVSLLRLTSVEVLPLTIIAADIGPNASVSNYSVLTNLVLGG